VSSSALHWALEAVSHRLLVTAPQLAQILQAFPEGDGWRRIDLYCGLFGRCCHYGPPLVDGTQGVLGHRPGWGIFSRAQRSEITKRLGLVHTLDWLHIHDPGPPAEPSSHSSPENLYILNLTWQDDKRIVSRLLELADKEPGENLADTHWSDFSSHFVGDWKVPATWKKHVPNTGTFTVTYRCFSDSDVSAETRRRCAMDSCWLVDEIGAHGAPE